MDYYLDPTTQYPLETTKCPGMNPVMQILEEVFDPTGTRVPAFRDCVLISLDAEYDTRTCQINQIGLAMLDTRKVFDLYNGDSARKALSSRLLLLARQSKRKGVYLFGDPEDFHGRCPKDSVVSAFKIQDSNSMGFRNVILVGHSIRNDIREFERSYDFSILALPMIKAVVDTSVLVNRIYNTSSRYHSLRDTCTLLGMYKRNIHTAGNDAMYTLKALLLLFCHYKGQKQLWDFGTESSADRKLLYDYHLEAIKEIARCNNGLGRFRKQQEKAKRNSSTKKGRSAMQNHDILYDGEDEGGLIDGLFAI